MSPKKAEELARLEQSQRASEDNLAEWRAKRLHKETLPSGLKVELRDVDLPSIMMEGGIPNTLIETITSEDFQKLSEEEATSKMMENGTDFTSMMKAIVKAALVKPAIGETADDKHLLYGELTFEDKIFIFNRMNREAAQMTSFREGESEPITDAQPG